MSVGEWQPSQQKIIDLAKLKQVLEQVNQVDETQLLAGLAEDFVAEEKFLMVQQQNAWQAAVELADSELICLIRFFTLAEMQLPGWQGGKLSPVIYLVKILRARSGFEADLRRWIKSTSDNRFLPNGAAL
ncbi:MAG: hypothetical protein KUG79_16760 [Pseudomonadales bacterium]|nr:hypothetical protein [Pseudomonadales bacterium]